MSDKFLLTIVVPAYKEEKRIHLILEAIDRYQKKKDFLIETIVVVDASPDDTVSAASKFKATMPHLRVIEERKNKGKGGAVKIGVMEAKGKYVLFADADNSTPIEQADKLLKFADSYEMVIGSRYCRGGKLAIPQPFSRRLGSRVLNFLIQTIAIWGIKDTQCGFKLFETGAAQKIFSRVTLSNFSFDIELFVIAKKLGYRIKEVGITWYDNPHSTVNPIKDGLRMIVDSWKVRQNALAGKYRH